MGECSVHKTERGRAELISCLRGGVRGVVELKILFRIQEEVGFGIKIQDLFDLVIGTSTGMFSEIAPQ